MLHARRPLSCVGSARSTKRSTSTAETSLRCKPLRFCDNKSVDCLASCYASPRKCWSAEWTEIDPEEFAKLAEELAEQTDLSSLLSTVSRLTPSRLTLSRLTPSRPMFVEGFLSVLEWRSGNELEGTAWEWAVGEATVGELWCVFWGNLLACGFADGVWAAL
eukprot:3670069-Rhodomonas_salina.1